MDALIDALYLAGSFTDVNGRDMRDVVIEKAPFKVIDARENPQYAMFEVNKADLDSAIYSKATGVCLPAGKPYGVMTLVEAGAAYSSGSEVLVANEVTEPSLIASLLKKISKAHFSSIEKDFLEHLQSYKLPEKEFPKRPAEHKGDVNRILLCGNMDARLESIKNSSGKQFSSFFDLDSLMKSYEAIKKGETDLVVVSFPKGPPHDRAACFMMGAANYHKIPVILYTDRKAPYPPLTGGLQRRLFTDMETLEYYLKNIKSNDISPEARLMYDIFKRFDGEM